MSAARRKGKWVGGTPVLGYNVDPAGGRLVVNDKEAQRVREIFRLFKTHRSLLKIVDELANTKTSERAGRAQDHHERNAMQKLRARGFL